MARPRQVTDEQILTATRECILEHGPGVSTTVIAESLGVSQAALFKRFGSKEDLVVSALLPSGKPPFSDLLTSGPDERPIPEQLRELAVQIDLYFTRMVPCLSMLRASGVDPHRHLERDGDPPPLRWRREMKAWVRRARDAGRVRIADPQAFATIFLGALQSRAFFHHVLNDREGEDSAVPPSETYIDGLIETVWTGIAPEVVR